MRHAAFCCAFLLAVACGDDSTAGDDADVKEDANTDVEGDVAQDDAESDAADFPFVQSSTVELEDDPAGVWLSGDLHVHATGASNDTGGDSFPADIKRMAVERGLDFVVLTDHSNSTGSDVTTTDEDPDLFNQGPEFPYWDEAAELSEAGVFLMIDGNEVSPVAEGDPPTTPTGHIGCIPADLSTFDRSGAFMDRPRGTVTGSETLAQAQARGCFAILNHPYGSTPWIAFDWSGEESDWSYDAIEVWNGTLGYSEEDRQADDLWRCDLLAGRTPTAIGASDNHRVNIEPPGMLFNPALGYPATDVFASEFSWSAIIEGLRAGRTRIGDGGSRVQLDAYDAEGTRTESAETRRLRLRVTLDPILAGATLRVHHATSCTDPRPTPLESPEIEEERLVNYTIVRDEVLDVLLEIDGAPGVYTAEISTPSGHYGARSGAVVIE